MPRFRWSFQPQIAWANPNLRPTVRSNVRAVIWWPQAIFHIQSRRMRDEARDCGKSVRAPPLVSFVLRHHVVKVMSSVFKLRCQRREGFSVLTSECGCYAGWMGHIVSSLCVKRQMSLIEADEAAIAAECNSGGRPDKWSAKSLRWLQVLYTIIMMMH